MFCAVTAVIADVPNTPKRAKVFRSAWIPAPPPESEPASEKDCGDLGGGFRAAPVPRQETRTMKLDWKDVEEIGIQLQQKLKGVDPLTVRFTDLHRHVLALEGFAGDPKLSNEKILEAIQMAWLDEYQAERG